MCKAVFVMNALTVAAGIKLDCADLIDFLGAGYVFQTARLFVAGVIESDEHRINIAYIKRAIF